MPKARKPAKRALASDAPTDAERRWRPLVEEWRRSGAEITEFCRRRKLKPSAFWHWKKEIAIRDRKRQARRAAAEASRNAAKFVPVRVVDRVKVAEAPVEVVLSGGHVVRLRGDFDPAVLRKLVETLEPGR